MQVDRYLRRLDQELQKFKMELEADNAGITEILEKSTEHLVAMHYLIYLAKFVFLSYVDFCRVTRT